VCAGMSVGCLALCRRLHASRKLLEIELFVMSLGLYAACEDAMAGL
jgi:hypothetical protein